MTTTRTVLTCIHHRLDPRHHLDVDWRLAGCWSAMRLCEWLSRCHASPSAETAAAAGAAAGAGVLRPASGLRWPSCVESIEPADGVVTVLFSKNPCDNSSLKVFNLGHVHVRGALPAFPGQSLESWLRTKFGISQCCVQNLVLAIIFHAASRHLYL